jgi:hypothetical protein
MPKPKIDLEGQDVGSGAAEGFATWDNENEADEEGEGALAHAPAMPTVQFGFGRGGGGDSKAALPAVLPNDSTDQFGAWNEDADNNSNDSRERNVHESPRFGERMSSVPLPAEELAAWDDDNLDLDDELGTEKKPGALSRTLSIGRSTLEKVAAMAHEFQEHSVGLWNSHDTDSDDSSDASSSNEGSGAEVPVRRSLADNMARWRGAGKIVGSATLLQAYKRGKRRVKVKGEVEDANRRAVQKHVEMSTILQRQHSFAKRVAGATARNSLLQRLHIRRQGISVNPPSAAAPCDKSNLSGIATSSEESNHFKASMAVQSEYIESSIRHENRRASEIVEAKQRLQKRLEQRG